MQVLEGLRAKVVRLEAEVEAGRREHEDWCLVRLVFILIPFDNFCNNSYIYLSSRRIDSQILLCYPYS